MVYKCSLINLKKKHCFNLPTCRSVNFMQFILILPVVQNSRGQLAGQPTVAFNPSIEQPTGNATLPLTMHANKLSMPIIILLVSQITHVLYSVY